MADGRRDSDPGMGHRTAPLEDDAEWITICRATWAQDPKVRLAAARRCIARKWVLSYNSTRNTLMLKAALGGPHEVAKVA